MEVTMKELEDKQDVAALSDGAVVVKPRRKWTLLDKRTANGLLAMHFLSLLAPFYCNWAAFWVAYALVFVTGLGISVSYHRNLAHKSFKLPKWLEYSFAYLGVHAFQGDPIDWVSTHRYHHQFVDTARDPHSPLEGFWFSHIAWMFDSYGLTRKVCPKNVRYYEEQREKPKSWSKYFVGHVQYGIGSNVEDLQKQWFYRFIRETYILHPLALAVILYAVGGLPFVVWGMGVRLVFALHVTFLVNSACHIWGYQQWNTRDLSKNNWVVGLLSFGEGWHNNHHAFEYSARHGLQWWQIDGGWWVVMFLQALGLATDVKLPSQLHMKKMALNNRKMRDD